jgi:hypothetical protein
VDLLALVTWAGAYGVITLIIWLLGPTMAGWPLVLRTALTRLFRAWLVGATAAPAQRVQAPGSG